MTYNVYKWGLHSLRAGGALRAANMGISDRFFKRHGRWKSENAKDGYIRTHWRIDSLFLEVWAFKNHNLVTRSLARVGWAVYIPLSLTSSRLTCLQILI